MSLVEEQRSIFGLPDPGDGGLQRPVRVFEADPDLLGALDPPTARLVRDRAIAESVVLPEGSWTPPSTDELGAGALGLLVLDGFLTRTLRFGGVASPELVGTGDLLRPWDNDDSLSLAVHADWQVLDRAVVALLDERFARRMCRVPGVTSGLLRRSVERSRVLSFQLAIAHVRRAEPRVLMLFWHLADRWGRVTPRGTLVPLALTHATIARLVCMRRPTVSGTLARMVRAGRLARNADGTWLLRGDPPDLSLIAARCPPEKLAAA